MKITYYQDYYRPIRKDYPKSFDFFGYSFKPMKKKSVKNNGVFLGFDGEMSMKSRSRIIGEWRDLNFQRNSSLTLQDLAKMLNIKSRGIINYYGKMNILAVSKLFRYLDLRLAKWVKNKFKSLKSSYKKQMIGYEILSRNTQQCFTIGN